MKIGLTFGGGAARGMAHLGVLSVLEKAQIPFDYVSACSAGAVIAALYCAGLSCESMRKMADHVSWKRIAGRSKNSSGIVTFDRLERWLVMVLGDLDFEDLRVPLSIVTTDARTGTPAILNDGRVAKAVHASCAVPGFVSPVQMGDRLLVDGGIVDNLPVSAARKMGAEFVIASNVFEPVFDRNSGPLGWGITAIEVLIHRAGGGIDDADFLIAPHTAEFSYYGFDRYKELVALGEETASRRLPQLLRVLEERGISLPS